MKKTLSIILLSISIPYSAWRIFQFYWYQGFIPEKINIAYSVNINGISGIREGCSSAIFRITNASASTIFRDG